MLQIKLLYLIIFKLLKRRPPYLVRMNVVEISKVNCQPNYKMIKSILDW